MNDSIAHWESVLEAEGLRVINDTERLHSFRDMTAEQIELRIVAVETWQRWAISVLAEYEFANDHQRLIWLLYAEGYPSRRIPSELTVRGCFSGPRRPRDGLGRIVKSPESIALRSIERLIADVKSHYPDRPKNPWSRKETT